MHNIKRKFRFFMEFFFSAEGAFVIGVTGLVLAYYFYYINKPILEYDTKTTKIVSDSNETGIVVKVNGKEYKNLYLTSVILENSGGVGLSGKDVSPVGDDPVRIIFPQNNKIVSYHIDNNQTSDEISSKLLPAENELIIEFNYINPDSRITVNIVHEENIADFKMRGNALNVGNISPKNDINKCNYLCWGILGIFYLLMYLLYAYRRAEEVKNA